MISSPSLTSIFLRSSSTIPPLLVLILICFLSSPFAPSLRPILLPALSYLHLPNLSILNTSLLSPISDFSKSNGMQVRCLLLLQKQPLCSGLQCDFVSSLGLQCLLAFMSDHRQACLSLVCTPISLSDYEVVLLPVCFMSLVCAACYFNVIFCLWIHI